MNVKYVYYDPATMQVMAEFSTPKLSRQKNWAKKGYKRAIVPLGMDVTRDHKIETIDDGDQIVSVAESINPIQPVPRSKSRLDDLYEKLTADTITDKEVREMLLLERGLGRR